jgi:hypothetical protein
MTASPHPSFLLCCRCSSCELADSDEAAGWYSFVVPQATTLDVCPRCAEVLLKVLRQTPDLLEFSQ